MSELESYGGVFECQRFRDLMMYSISVFSYGLPRAMEILADCMWRPKITEEEVQKYDSVHNLQVALLYHAMSFDDPAPPFSVFVYCYKSKGRIVI